jgi:hypothetical protein
VDSQRIRVEIIRFMLLLVVTVGLISVAQRAFDDDTRTTGAQGHPPATSTPPGTSAPTTPGQPSATASPSASDDGNDGSTVTADGSTSGGSSSGSGSGTGSGSAGATGATGASDDGRTDADGQPMLPRTGPESAVRLAGLAFVFIVAGSLSVIGTRRRA